MKKLLSILLALAMLISMVPMALADDVIELDMYFPVSVGGGPDALINALCEEFHAEHPGIKINPVYAGSYADTRTKVLAAIEAKNTPAIALMFSCARFVSHAGHTMRQGKWEKKAYGKGFELGGKTLGVIGYGRIGKRIGDIAQGIGMNVIAYQRTYKPEYECETMHFVTLDELFAKSDIIALSTPALGKAIIDAESIAKMKDGVVIINTSRGSNIDEQALLEALNSGKVRAAGLDVWAEEPTKNVELSQHPAVSALPHIGASTAEAQKRIGTEIVSIIENF